MNNGQPLTYEQIAYLEEVQRQQQAQVYAYQQAQQQQYLEQQALDSVRQQIAAQQQAAQIQENSMHARAIADQVLGMQPIATNAPQGVNPYISQNSFHAQQIAQRVAEMQQPYVQEEPAATTYGDWGYMLLAFVIFSVSLAIVRRQFSNLAKKANVKKEVKKRFGGLFGNPNAQAGNNANNRPENAESFGFGSGDKKENNERDKNLIVDGDNEAQKKDRKKITYTNQDQSTFSQGMHFLQSSVGKVIGTQKKAKNSDDEGEEDPCEYEVLDDCNNSKDRRVNLDAQETKTLWTKDGPKTVDDKGNEVKKHEESKSNVLDGSKEGDDHESPVALLSAMDLNCDDDQINTLIEDGAESGSRGSSPNEAQATGGKKQNDLNSSILKKLYGGSKPARKAAVVVEDDEPDYDAQGELTTATDQATIEHVVDELNDLMNCHVNETNEEQPAFMKIDEAL